MYELKTRVNDNSVIEFIEKAAGSKRLEDLYELLDIFTEATGLQPKMWGESMIGFGSYHYKYASGHEGDAMLVGFSPRKAKISLYLAMEEAERERLLKDFGKYTTGKGCVYINKLSDVDVEVLKELIKGSVEYLTKLYKK